MKTTNFFYTFACSTLLAIILPCAVHATSITNLSDKTYGFQLKVGAEERLIKLEPNDTWRTTQHPVLLYRGSRTQNLRKDGEYTLWPDGTFALQVNRGQVRGN